MLSFITPVPTLRNHSQGSIIHRRAPLRPPRNSRYRMTTPAPPSPPTTRTQPPTAPSSVHTANVVIVGAGPCGAVAAAHLHHRGIPCTLIEKVSDFSDFNPSRSFHQVIFYRGRKVLAAVPGLLAYLSPWGLPFFTNKFTTWNPDGQVKMFQIDAPRCDSNPELRFLRSHLSDGLKRFLEDKCHSVNAMYGSVVDRIDFQEDGAMRLTVLHDGRLHTISTRLVLACDGRNSTVIKELVRAEKESASVTSSKGSGLTTYDSPAVGLNIKGIVLKENFTEFLKPSSPMDDSGDRERVIRGYGNTRPKDEQFSLGIFQIVPQAVDRLGGFLALTVNKPNHKVWQLQTVEQAYKMFEENFPQLDVRGCIAEENMANFVKTRSTVFCPVTRRNSLSFHVGASGDSGVLVLGDAAHSFPPDTGQGVNAALEDVAVFTDLLEKCAPDASLGAVLKEYEARRDADTSALTKIAQVASPYQYRQNMLGLTLTGLNIVGRKKLAERFPNVFHPPLISLVFKDLSYSHALSRADATTVRMSLIAASLVCAPLVSFMVLSGMGR